MACNVISTASGDFPIVLDQNDDFVGHVRSLVRFQHYVIRGESDIFRNRHEETIDASGAISVSKGTIHHKWDRRWGTVFSSMLARTIMC